MHKQHGKIVKSDKPLNLKLFTKKTMITSTLDIDAGPATLIPLLHVPLLTNAPRQEGEYKTITDSLGDLCHFYGDFSGYHLYMIVSSYKKKIIPGSVNYFDKKNGKFSVSLSVTLDNGTENIFEIYDCQTPLIELTESGPTYPESISIESFSPGTPDGLKFHFKNNAAKFKFSNNLTPFIQEKELLSKSHFFNLNIEYIGKAVGKDGTREVADRLGNGHSTESLILNEFLHKKTNRDAYAVMYKPGRVTDKNGVENTSVSYSTLVDILEKSLISSFLPIKNKQSRNFPNDGSDSMINLMRLGINRLIITVSSPKDYGLLFTDDATPEIKHIFELKVKHKN